jgi:threonine aldolase
MFDPDQVRRAVRPPVPHLPRTSLVWAENTHNYAGGAVWPLALLDEVAKAAHDAGLPFHLDGARLWNASVACGADLARIAASADTVSVCISKALGAPVGSLVAGRREFIDRCWVIRKQMGGGMRQSGILAAAGLYALDHNLHRLAEDHDNALALARSLAQLDGISIDLEATQTNIVVFDVAATGKTPQEILSRCAERGVLMVAFGPTRIRAVTHLDVSRQDVMTAFEVVAETLGQPAAARGQSSEPRAQPAAARGGA